jgi:light-regulated signal transduction histidine kinase (bacteriophytochrome)
VIEMFGVDRPTALTISIADHYSSPDNPLDLLPVIWEMVVAGEDQLFEWRARRIDNNALFDVEVSLRRIILNQRYAILATVRDITARKRAEQEIETLNTHLASHVTGLEAANRELEAFNFTVSHDLRSPLTGICGYSYLLQEQFSERLGEQCLGYVRVINSAAVKMGQLIDTLLGFSRLSRCEVKREETDLTAITKGVAAQLRMADPSRQVRFAIAEGVKATGDANLLSVVMENLIGNAWKYTARQESTLIEFGLDETNASPAYFVRDNGPGFDMAHADRLFRPFQRLPGTTEFATGHGIGLATVQRIVERHGGSTWACGEPGKGATFYFTL